MKYVLSEYLKSKKPLMKEIVNELSKTYKYISILGIDTKGKNYRVTAHGRNLGDSNLCERGFVCRIFNGYNYSEYSFNNLNDENMASVLKEIHQVVDGDVSFYKEILAFNEYAIIEEEPMVESWYGDYEIHPDTVSEEEKMKTLEAIMEVAIKSSDKLVDIHIHYDEAIISKLFISTKKEMEQAYGFATGFIYPIVESEGKIKYEFGSVSDVGGVEVIQQLDGMAETLIDNAVELLSSERVIPGEYEIICNPEVTGLIAHEAFGHGVEMDMFVKDRAKGKEYIDKRVASPKVIMHDGSQSAKEVGTYLFDDEGILGTDTIIIEKGILKKGISDLLSAMYLGEKPTGNGRRESFERKAYARMTNTFFAGGDDTLEEMIASIEYGYLLENFDSGMEDPKNWGIQCMISKGREIKNGKLTGKIISPVMLTGYVPDLLESISMVSGDIRLSGSGYCGKGHKEFVKTSTGGSYIKAKGRLG